MSWASVRRLWGIRARICSLVSRSVSETFTVRSKGSVPPWTLESVLIVARIANAQPITERRNRFRATSIFLARAISCSRVRSGMTAIWVR